MPKPRAPTLAQLCAIAKRVFDASVDDFEWRERIKRVLVAQRLAYPPPHVVSEAMDRVARAHPRPSSPVRPEPSGDEPPVNAGLSHAEACTALTDLAKRFGPLPPMKPMPSPRVLTVRQAERCRAWQIVAQAIVEQVTRCEAAEEAPHVFDFEDGDDTPGGPRR